MKNKKGQLGISAFIMVAIAAIVGAILLAASAQNIHPTIHTVDINESITLGAVNVSIAIPGQAVSGTFVLRNATNGTVIPSVDYHTANNQILASVLTATLNVTETDFGGTPGRIEYTSEPEGYSTNAGARALAGMIIIFFALGIAVVVLTPTLRSKILESMKR